MKQLAILATAALLSLAVAACGKASAKSADLKPLDVADSGFVVDAPADWTAKKDMDHFYSVTGAGGQAQIIMTEHDSMPESLDAYVMHAHCADAAKATKETTAGGAMFVSCATVAGKANGKDLMATKVQAIVKADKGTVECSFASDKDADLIASVCKSIRKK
jgi:hypothetical protein